MKEDSLWNVQQKKMWDFNQYFSRETWLFFPVQFQITNICLVCTEILYLISETSYWNTHNHKHYAETIQMIRCCSEVRTTENKKGQQGVWLAQNSDYIRLWKSSLDNSHKLNSIEFNLWLLSRELFHSLMLCMKIELQLIPTTIPKCSYNNGAVMPF